MQQAKSAPTPEKLSGILQAFELLEDVPREQLVWLAQKGEVRQYKPGALILKKDDPIDTLFIILAGKLQFKLEQNGEHRIINELIEGDISGALPYSRAKVAMAYAEARGQVQVLAVAKKHFEEMVRSQPDLTEALVHVMTSRVRDFTHTQQQTEKLAALGRLSAGLHHELNNPAAAALRASTELKHNLNFAPEKFKAFMLMHLRQEQVDQIGELLSERLQYQKEKKLSMLERSSLEDEIAKALKQYNFEDPFAMAEVFADFGFSTQELEKVQTFCDSEQAKPVVDWLYHMLANEKLVTEIQESTRRISTLVGAVKTYSHMDRSPERERTDLEASIRSTLAMLNHKLKEKKIKVDIKAPENLPNPCVFAGELNQVWTNLIDNAIDAMEQEGLLEITIEESDAQLEVTITDNGSGIPADKLDKIFDPFFSTKSIGEGTGMGLDISKKIIDQHGGTIKTVSTPGQTSFIVSLPENPVT